MGYTPPTEIDIGSPAINRDGYLDMAWTYIDLTNPANASGKITSVEIYARANYNLANCEVATFFLVSGSNYSTRGTHTIGAVTGGSKQTFSGLDIEVEAGDFIGIRFSSGHLEFDTSGGTGILYKSGDYIPCTNETFSVYDANGILSLYGAGGSATGELTIGDSFSITDSKTTSISKVLAEAFSIADSWIARLRFGELLDIADSLVKNATEQLTEAFSAVDSWAARLSFSEAFSIVDSLTKSATKQLAETLLIVDSWVSRLGLAEAFSIIDAYVARKIWGEEAKTTVTWIEETKKETSPTEEIKKTASWVEETKNDGVI